jgi:hypothetical protein
MAKYAITHRCGHVQNAQLYGPESNRQALISREERKPCPECRKAAWISEHKDDAPNVVVRRIPPAKPSPWCRVELICYGNTFQHKDELKEHGYQFGEYQLKDGIFADLVAASRTGTIANNLLHGTKGWAKIIAARADDEQAGTQLIEEFKKELLWLGSLGFQIIERPAFNSFYLMGAALTEGREDLL